MPNTMTLIQKITAGQAEPISIAFNNIPQTYTDLYIVLSMRSADNGVADGLSILLNGSQNNFSLRGLQGSGTSVISYNNSTNRGQIVQGNGATANTFSNLSIYIPNYTSSNYKSISVDGVTENNGSEAYTLLSSALWSNNAAITSIEFQNSNKIFYRYSTAYLYGVSNSATSTPNTAAAYATGGDDITTDGTYWIHTFRSSGTFTPRKALSNVDYLVVAGGGAGGANQGGGGGAGGLRCTVGSSGGGGSLESKLSLISNTNYTVTVGAGGTGVYQTVGTAGSNSVFATITSTGGAAGAAARAGTTPSTGGSGGGGSGGNGGAGTANQGYAGGNAFGSAFNNHASGGGGGAGAVGANGTNTPSLISGNGGNGVTTSISGTSTTYGGGGGGGAFYSGVTPGNGGNGGGANGSSGDVTPTAATANTGGGGGGCGAQINGGTGGNGGSGIVIVRYPV